MMNLCDRLSKNGLVIFLFHGVIERSNYSIRNYTNKHLEKSYFYKIIKNLKKGGYPLSMDDVVKHNKRGEPFPPYSFAVTFDDGFENNYSVAAPILKDFNIPATFYLTIDFIENNHMSWIDHVEYCLENIPQGRLIFPWNQSSYSFKNRRDKIQVLDFLRNNVKGDPEIDLDNLVNDIYSQCGLEAIKQSNDPLDLKLNWEQVRKLDSDKDFIIGGHSYNHRTLSFLNQVELEYEIKTSIEILKKNGLIKTRHYSYPEGLDYCYSSNVIEMLKKYGIACSPTAEEGINYFNDSLFHLKRINVA